MMNRNLKQRGVILLTATIVLVAVAALGAAFLVSSFGNSRYTRQQTDLSRAAAIAQAGIDQALYDLAYGNVAFGTDWTPKAYANGNLYIYTRMQQDAQGAQVENTGRIFAVGEFNGLWATVEATVWNDAYEIHALYYKAIYAGNDAGGDYHIEFTGVNHQRSNRDQNDRVDGDIHIEGDIVLGTDASAHRFGQLDATGNIIKLDELGEFKNFLGGGGVGHISPPSLARQGYESDRRQYKSWDTDYQGGGRDVVHVGEEYGHFGDLNMLQTLRIAQEGGYFSEGGYDEWNTHCTALPDGSLANFFHKDYQNHFADTFASQDDTRMSATENYYLGQRNGGTASSYGDRHGLYGGGHSVITITEEMNNKVYLVDGNLWIDSDGDNHIFFVPGEGVDRVNITLVAKGNIYIGDQVFVTTNDVNADQTANNIGGSTGAEAYSLTDPESGVALIAMADGESFNDLNKNGMYDEGETIIGRENPNLAEPAGNNPSPAGTYSTGYQGRMEGSGNVIFGDTICGPVGVVEAFMFAENNFCDITADTSQGDQNPFIFGNMSAGNRVYLNRHTDMGWLDIKPANNFTPPDGWVQIDGAWFPEGTTPENVNNPFETYHMVYPGTWESTINHGWYQKNGEWYFGDYIVYEQKNANGWTVMQRTHNPLRMKYDERLEFGTISLPGLPHSTESHAGAWKIVVWRQYSGRPTGWTPPVGN